MYQKRLFHVEEGKVLVLAIKGRMVNARILRAPYRDIEIGYGTIETDTDEIAYYVIDSERSRRTSIRRAIVSRRGAIFRKGFKKPVLVLLGETGARLSTRKLDDGREKISCYFPKDAVVEEKNYFIDFTLNPRKKMIHEVQIVALNKATAEALG